MRRRAPGPTMCSGDLARAKRGEAGEHGAEASEESEERLDVGGWREEYAQFSWELRREELAVVGAALQAEGLPLARRTVAKYREVLHIRDSLVPRYAEMVYYGYWFAPEMEILKKTIDETQKDVTGTVRLKLYKGNCIVVGRKSPNSLYSEDIASFEKSGGYEQKDATGFIRLNALRLRIAAYLRKKKGK